MRLLSLCLLMFFPCILLAQPAAPREFKPDDVWVVVNRNMPASVALGEYYCQQRKVPMDHIIRLDLPESEEMNRAEYETRLRDPLREQLRKLEQTDFILLTTYGVPIRVGFAQPKPEDAGKLEIIKKDLQKITSDLAETTETVKKLAEAGERTQANQKRVALANLTQSKTRLEQQEMILSQKESNAAVDSELSMLWYPNYPLSRWQLNLRFFTIPEANRLRSPQIIMTCRIDGPTPTVAKRLIDDAIKAEAAGGPEGFAYIDARGMPWDKAADLSGGSYGGYDESLRESAVLLKKAGFQTTLNNTEPLFPVGSCPRTALYCGWYALQNYTPAFELMQGSVAYHLASFEAVSLREKNNKRWVANLLQDGACVSIGPVWEPYLIGFPKPATFFGFLISGHSVVESYWLSNHFTSWQMLLIGDPLYRPFGKKPRLQTSEVKLSPAGSQFPNARPR